jgi:alpha-tubulin suppressor-like RCC1 family protein
MTTCNPTLLTNLMQTLLATPYFNQCASTTDSLAAALNIQSLNDTIVITVPTVDNLPDLLYLTDRSGMIYYVQNLGVLTVSSGTRWLTLDGRLLRQDRLTTAESWGGNFWGQLGDNTTINKSSPISIVGGFSNWCQVSAGYYHSVGLRQHATAWTWGRNNYGQLGDNTTTNRSSPVSVVGGFSDWCQVSAGYISIGIRTTGSAWAWGVNANGQLGDNTIVSKRSPVSVVGGFTDWCQVSAKGNFHTLAIRRNGTAWAWGYNGGGRLGDNTITSRRSPVTVVGQFTDWCNISGGCFHSLGVRNNGSAWAWGSNSYGRLGDTTTTNRSSPVSVVGGFSDWCQVSGGAIHSLGLRTNGTAWAWGGNFSGRLGDGTVTSKSSPVTVVGGFADWCSLQAGDGHSLALRTNGSAWAWGANASGQLGDNTVTNRSSPVSVTSGSSNWYQVNAGAQSSLGIRNL